LKDAENNADLSSTQCQHEDKMGATVNQLRHLVATMKYKHKKFKMAHHHMVTTMISLGDKQLGAKSTSLAMQNMERE